MKQPIVYFDLETTGVDTVKDRIVQIAIIKELPDGSRETKDVLIDPCRPIPKEATEVHGITDEMVKGKPKFRQIAKGLLRFLEDCILAGFNSDRFDIPLLGEEFARCDINWPAEGTETIDIILIERVINSHRLTDTYERYFGEPLGNAHNAFFDVVATEQVFHKQLELLKVGLLKDKEISPTNIRNIYADGKELFDYSGNFYKKEGKLYWNFGKNRDCFVKDDMSYIQWYLKSDFPRTSKAKLQEYLRE